MTIKKVLQGIDNDIKWVNLNTEKPIKLSCLEIGARYNMSVENYIYLYYQSLTFTNFDNRFNIFSILQHMIDNSSDSTLYPIFNFVLHPEIHLAVLQSYNKDRYGDNFRSIEITDEKDPYRDLFFNDFIDAIEKRLKYSKSILKYLCIPITLQLEQRHQNGLMLEQGENHFTLAFFEPHGAYGEKDVIITFGKTLKSYLSSRYPDKTINLMFNDKVSRSLGLQNSLSIPLCVMFTYLWFYVLYQACLIINDKMENWINNVESMTADYVMNQQDPELFMFRFSYFVIQQTNIYISRNDKILKNTVDYKNAYENIRKLFYKEGSIDKNLNDIKDTISISQYIKIIFCILAETVKMPNYTARHLKEYKELCETSEDCYQDVLCINKKCRGLSPIYEGIYIVTYRGRILKDVDINNFYINNLNSDNVDYDENNRIIFYSSNRRDFKPVIEEVYKNTDIELILVKIIEHTTKGMEVIYKNNQSIL